MRHRPPLPPPPCRRLRLQKISSVYIAGLAANYCCNYTAVDARNAGFVTHFLLDLTRGAKPGPGSFEPAELVNELSATGVHVVSDSSTLVLP